MSVTCLHPFYRFIVKQWNLWFLQFLIEQRQPVLLMDKLVYVGSSLDTLYVCSILNIISTNILHLGSGKTYTMHPLPLKASQDILRLMYHTYRNQGFQLFVSFFEIYGGKLFDHLNDKRWVTLKYVIFRISVYQWGYYFSHSECALLHAVNIAWERMENKRFALLVY